MERDEICHDLTIEILNRLPAKSLMKFQCVSKLWLSVIRSKKFTDSFFVLSSTRPKFQVVFTNNLFTKLVDTRFYFSSSSSSPHGSSIVTNLDMTIPSLSIWFLICNPSTGQVIVLPPLPEIICPDMRGRCLGYDPVTDQFKVLALISSRVPNRNRVMHMVLTLKGDRMKYSWRPIHNNKNIPPYSPFTMKVCINGVVYYGARAPKPGMDPVIVCFHVGSENITFIKAPEAVVCWSNHTILLEYRGKLASIARLPYAILTRFDLWVLEDVEKHEWSRRTCKFPLSMWDHMVPIGGGQLSFPGTNKAGEIIIAPKYLPHHLGPFYIFYYHVETNNIRRVRVDGIADDQKFRTRYGTGECLGECYVFISPEHVETIRFL